MIFTEITTEEMDQFSRSQKNSSFLQSEAMAGVHGRQGRKILCYGVRDSDQLIAAAMINLRSVFFNYSIAHCNQGPMLDYNNHELVKFFVSNLKKELKRHHVIQLIITPNFEVVSRDVDGIIVDEFDHTDWIHNLENAGLKHQGFDNSLINGVGRWFFVKDFQQIKDDKSLLSSMLQSARTRISRIRRSAIRIEELQQDLSPFISVMDHTSDRRDFTNRTLDFYTSFLDFFGEDVKVFVARMNFTQQLETLQKELAQFHTEIAQLEEILAENPEKKKAVGRKKNLMFQTQSLEKRIVELQNYEMTDQVLAAAMFIYHAGEVTYLYSGAYDQYFTFEAPYALQYAAFHWAIEKGASRYNFYGTPGKYSGQTDDGIYQFKRGFGGRVIEQPGNFILPVLPIWHNLYAFYRKMRD